MKIKSWLKKFFVGMIKNGCCHSGNGTLKLAVSQEWIEWKNFACWCKFMKTEFLGGHG